MPFIKTVFKHLRIPIPVQKDLPSELISSIECEDIKIRLSREGPHPLISGTIITIIKIPKALKRIKFMTTGIKAEFYLLHPKTFKKIARLITDGWHESTSDKQDRLWKVEATVTDAPVEIIDDDGFDEWIGMMLQIEGEEMEVWVEGWCSAGVKTLGTKVKVKKIPVKASLMIPGIPKPNQLDPKAQNDLHVVETGVSHAKFTIHILFQNPTPYTLHVEYLHVHIYYDGTQIGEGWISDGEIAPRKQARALANITLNITEQSKIAMITLLSYYICGKKAEVEIRLHEKSIPSMPHLSKILGSNFAVKVIMPRLSPDQSSDKVLETNNPSEKFVPEDGKVGSPDQGLESPLILAATLNVLSATVRLKLFNPLNVPIHVSKVTAQAVHNTSHIGDLAAPDGWKWTLEPGVQETPDIPVTWSMLSFGLDPMKGFSMLFDGWQRSGEVSVDITAKATVQMGEMELGEIETSINGIATKVRV